MMLPHCFKLAAVAAVLAAPAAAQFPFQAYGPHFRVEASALSAGVFQGQPVLMLASVDNFPRFSWYPNLNIPQAYPGVQIVIEHLHVYETDPAVVGLPLEYYDETAGTFFRNTQPLFTIHQTGWNPPLDPTWSSPIGVDLTPYNTSNDSDIRFQYTDITSPTPGAWAPYYPDLLFAICTVRLL